MIILGTFIYIADKKEWLFEHYLENFKELL